MHRRCSASSPFGTTMGCLPHPCGIYSRHRRTGARGSRSHELGRAGDAARAAGAPATRPRAAGCLRRGRWLLRAGLHRGPACQRCFRRGQRVGGGQRANARRRARPLPRPPRLRTPPPPGRRASRVAHALHLPACVVQPQCGYGGVVAEARVGRGGDAGAGGAHGGRGSFARFAPRAASRRLSPRIRARGQRVGLVYASARALSVAHHFALAAHVARSRAALVRRACAAMCARARMQGRAPHRRPAAAPSCTSVAPRLPCLCRVQLPRRACPPACCMPALVRTVRSRSAAKRRVHSCRAAAQRSSRHGPDDWETAPLRLLAGCRVPCRTMSTFRCALLTTSRAPLSLSLSLTHRPCQ